MSFHKLSFFLFLGLLFSPVFGQDCTISAENSDEFLFEVYVQADGSTEMKTIWKIPYTQECVLEKGLTEFMGTPLKCDDGIISDVLFRSMNFFVINSECLYSFEKETRHLLIETASITEKIAKEDNGAWEIKFEKWDFNPPEQMGNKMKIVLPQGARVISFFPKKDGQERMGYLSWSPIPKEPIGIKYSVPVPIGRNPIAWGATIAIVLIAGAIIIKKLRDRHKVIEEIKTLKAKKVAINEEEKEMQVAYLKRRIDEQTFKKRVNELEEEKSEVDIEEKTIEVKEKIVGKGKLRRMEKKKQLGNNGSEKTSKRQTT